MKQQQHAFCLLVTISLFYLCPTLGFGGGAFGRLAACSSRQCNRVTLLLRSLPNNNSDPQTDDSDDSADGEPASLNQQDGRELANQFYKFQRNRENRGGSAETNPSSSPPPPPSASIKYTGRNPSLFSNPSNNDNERTRTQPNNALERQRRAEFNLASNFERTLPIQAGVLALTLGFVLYIGLTGGITNGSERDYFDDNDTMDYLFSNNVMTPMETTVAQEELLLKMERGNRNGEEDGRVGRQGGGTVASESIWL